MMNTAPVYDPNSDDEIRVTRALDAMLGLEDLLESVPVGAELPAASILALVALVHQAVRDVLVWNPPQPANDR